MLQSLIPTLVSVQKPISDSGSRDGWDYYQTNLKNSIINAYIAKLLFEQGNAADAEKSVSVGIVEAFNNVPFQYSLLAAEIAKDNQKTMRHAHTIIRKQRKLWSIHRLLTLVRDNQEMKAILLREAVKYGELAPSLDQTELATIYHRLGTYFEQNRESSVENLRLSLYYFERACYLTPDSDRQKVEYFAACKQFETADCGS